MSMFSRLLINAVLILSSGLVFAHDPDTIEQTVNRNYPAELTTSVSGFATATTFEDNNWQRDTQRVAVNLDAAYSYARASVQVGTGKLPVRRATLELAYPMLRSVDVVGTTGIIPRMDSFSNNATDNPGSAGTAILPFAGYNHRMQTGTFTLLDGNELKIIARTPVGLLITVRHSEGKIVIDDQEDVTKFVLGGNSSSEITMRDQPGSSDTTVHVEGRYFHALYSESKYVSGTQTSSTNPMTIMISAMTRNIEFTSRRAGLRFNNSFGWIQGERVWDDANYYAVTGQRTYWLQGRNYYVQTGIYVGDTYQVYAGYTKGHKTATDGDEHGIDRYIGVTRETGVYAVSIEKHKGSGRPWMKYGSQPPHEWDSLVASITYRF